MKNSSVMTEKEILVLTYLIKKESELISQNPHIDTHFYTYPGLIERELNGKVSRVHAKQVCDEFVQMGILQIDTKNTSKKDYFINSSFKTFKEIICLLIQNLETKKSVEILGQSYFQSKINDSLIKNVLFERNVTFRRKLDILNWEETEVKKLFKNKMENKNIRIKGSPIELLKSGKTVEDLVKELPDSDITTFDTYVQRKLQRIDDKDSAYINNQFYPIELDIVFPVLNISNKDDIDDYIKEIQSLNEKLFTIYPDLQSCKSAIYDHYKTWQNDNIVMLLLLLVKSSPNALVEFLCKSWKAESPYFCEGMFGEKFESFMEKLIFLALSDLALTGSYPKNTLIKNVFINDCIKKFDNKKQYESLSFEKDNGTIYYVTRAFFISLSDKEESGKRMPFTFVDKGKTYTEGLVEKIYNMNIENHSLIIQYLKNADKPVAKVILKNLPASLCNLIKYCNPEENIPLKLKDQLEINLRKLIIDEDWSELLYIGSQELSRESKDKLGRYLEHFANKIPELLRRDYRITMGQNILCDVFGGSISLKQD